MQHNNTCSTVYMYILLDSGYNSLAALSYESVAKPFFRFSSLCIDKTSPQTMTVLGVSPTRLYHLLMSLYRAVVSVLDLLSDYSRSTATIQDP